jgi:peptidoglycan/LPS O-acetylase OafA/YrhL
MKRLEYLDGLRGVAAMQVVFEHVVLGFQPAMFDAWPRILWDGNVAVFLFFLMSGFVLTGSFERAPDAVGSALLRRLVRLGLPLAVAAAFAFLLVSALPGHFMDAARDSGSAWLASMQPYDPLHALADISGATMITGYSTTTLFGALAPLLWTERATVDPPLWSLHIELWGSILLIVLIWAKWRSPWLYGGALAVCALLIGGNALDLFVIGALSASLIRTPRFEQLLRRPWITPAACAVLIAGIVVAEWGNHLPGTKQVEHAVMSGSVVRPFSFFQFISEAGAVLIYAAVLLMPAAQRLLSRRLPAWLGRMSFSVYLLHWPIMLTFGSAAYACAFPIGRSAAAACTLMVVVGLTLAAAVAFERWIDQPAVRLSRMVGRRRRTARPQLLLGAPASADS